MDPNPGGISSSHMMSRNSASLNRIPTMDNSNDHETEYRSISQQIDDFTSIAQCRAKFSILKQLYDNMSAAKIPEETFDLTKKYFNLMQNCILKEQCITNDQSRKNSSTIVPEKEWTTVKPNKRSRKRKEVISKKPKNDSEISLSQANPEYKNTPQAYSSSDTESYSSNMSEDVTSRIQTMQVDDDEQQADQPIKKAYIPPIIVDDPVNGKQLLEDLNHLTNEAVTGRVIGNKLKIFPPSAEAHRAIRREISDERKLKSHTYLLPQEKQLKVVIRGIPNDFPTKEIEEFLMSEGFEVQFVTHLRHRSGKGNMPLFLAVLPNAPTSLQNTISTNSVKMDKSPPNQVQPQLSGPSTSSSTPQENLTAQILQSLVKEVHVLTSNIASLLAALQSQSPLSHNIQ
ncbi:RNA-directed DNA polymerase from mobile element jockey [Caerostris darwini]|uniref:RNA-directed DNA polymerase from mobile element jockey n=1 Tax=Caerostris darwini TaxID=1538125 RepID=A0AAV4QCX9_9ARAC|nr:RNA-directed DNA polymerase from mobile element jockey [Caerostris darwini]